MSILGGGVFKGMVVTLRNFVGSYFYKDRLTTNDYSWRPNDKLPQRAGDYPKEEGEQLRDTTTVTNYSRNFPMLLHDGVHRFATVMQQHGEIAAVIGDGGGISELLAFLFRIVARALW